MKNKKHIPFSKIITATVIVLFVCTLLKVLTADYSTMIDVSVYATALTVSGTICLTNIVWYMKKSQAENVADINIRMYKEAMNTRYEYNEKMISLKREFELSDEDIYMIENEGDIDEISQNALNHMLSKSDEMTNDAQAIIERVDVM